MIEIFKKVNSNLEKIDAYEDSSWVNIVHPSEEEINTIIDKFDIPRDFITDSLDIDEVARLEIDDDNFILLTRIPVLDIDGEGSHYQTIPLGIIVLNNKLMITVCSRENDLVSDFIQQRIKNFDPAERGKSILQIFNRTNQLYIRYLKQLRHKAGEIEEDIQQSMKNEELVEIFKLDKSFIQFEASLKSNNRMIQKLQRSKLFKMDESKEDILEDVMIDIKQAIEMAEIYSVIMKEMMSFFSSLISNNLNVVMKFLTAVTIIIAIPTLVASIYGMNVSLPFQNAPHAFIITLVISAVAALMGIILFIYRKWI
ncbi:MAG: magnesium transporter CorA family protein [Candidatus Delongbacteria bacterium]|nr:magnesium transporter CorA family protein [Candidatus Delongbacteria bacterium]